MYDKPDKNISIYGKNIYAYITSLHEANKFNFQSILVLGYSLIKTGSFADRICIVSNDISDEQIELLKIFYIVYKTIDIKVHGQSYIKYMALNMTQYKKILIINPNFVILQNPDFLFTRPTPSAYFKSRNYISTELLLLEPNIGEFDSIIFDLQSSLIKIDEAEYIYNKYYSLHWYKIDENYIYQGTTIQNINNIKFIYYQTSPVGLIFADVHMEDIYTIWYGLYKEMLQNYPVLFKTRLLEGTNKTLKEIMRSKKISRQSPIEDTEILNIKNIYETNKIHMNLQKYYHIDKTNELLLDDIEPLFNDIDNYDYIKPINKLYDIFKNDYYKSLLKYTTSEEIPLHNYNYIDINDRETIMLMYLKCKKNIDIIILEGDEKDNGLKIDKLKLNGIFYIKTLNLNKKAYENLLFFSMNNKSYYNRIEEINNKNIKDNNIITIVFIKKDSDNFQRTIFLGSIILNHSNINILNHQDTKSLALPFMYKSLLYINTLNNWLQNNFSLLEKERLLLFGDIVLNAYGAKNIQKIEGVFVSIDSNEDTQYEKNIETIIYDTFINKNSGFHFTNITKENSIEYNKYHKNIIEKMKIKAGVEKTIDLISNPNNYINYFGLKIINTELNMLYIESEKEIDTKTDIVMTNIVNKNILSRFISYNLENRIVKTNKKFKLSKKDIIKIKNNAKDKYMKVYINKLVN